MNKKFIGKLMFFILFLSLFIRLHQAVRAPISYKALTKYWCTEKLGVRQTKASTEHWHPPMFGAGKSWWRC
jgi:hypothetical protein